jgi:MATE family multidrug resistance protein
MAILLAPGPALRYTQVPAALQAEVRQYLLILAFSLWPALFFRLFSTLNQALHHPRLVTGVQLCSLLLKIPLSIWFTWGGLGVPALGATGAALATWTVNFVMMGIALGLLRQHALYPPYALWQKPEPPNWSVLKTLLRQGIPSGLSIFVEVTSFTLMALFISRLGTTATASHQIAANLGALLYMVPLSVSIATSARTGYWLGAKAPDAVRRAVLTGLTLTLALSWSCAALLWWGRFAIPGWYSPVPAVQQSAIPLLAWVAVFHVADGLQTLCVFVLRCFRITVSTFVVYGSLLWGLGLGGGYLLAYGGFGENERAWISPWHLKPDAFWAASTIALLSTALVFSAMLWRALRRQA